MIYTALALCLKRGISYVTQNLADYTPSDFQALCIQPDVAGYIFVRDEDDVIHVLDYTHMATYEKSIYRATTWIAIARLLTEQLVDGYEVHLPGFDGKFPYPRPDLIFWDATNVTKTFDLTYSEKHSEQDPIFAIRYKQPDLRFKIRPTAPIVPDITKCIPVVNGVACRPWIGIDSHDLYACGGATYCWKAHIRVPEVNLLDFSNIGEVETLTITNTTASEKEIACSYPSMGQEWEFTLDTEFYNLREWTPLVVIGGLVLWPDMIHRRSDAVFSFKPWEVPIERMLGWKKFLQAEATGTAAVAYDAEAIYTWFQQTLANGFSDHTFVVMVHVPELFVTRMQAVTYREAITIENYHLNGILHCENTGAIQNYHADELESKTVLKIAHGEDLFISDEPIPDVHEVFIKPDCKHHTFLRYQESSYEMLYIFKE